MGRCAGTGEVRRRGHGLGARTYSSYWQRRRGAVWRFRRGFVQATDGAAPRQSGRSFVAERTAFRVAPDTHAWPWLCIALRSIGAEGLHAVQPCHQ